MRRAKGMTLLEVLIATTILASLTVIVSTLWAQTKQWTEEVQTHDSALRLQRAIEMLDRQWESRLLDVSLVDGDTGAVRVDATRLEFITTYSVLFPDWPIVKAVYIAQQSSDSDATTTEWSLMYEEVRLGIESATAAEIANNIGLRNSTLIEFTNRPSWSVVLSDEQIAEWETSRGITSSEETSSGSQRWIDFSGNKDRKWAGLEDAIDPEAVRLDGETAEGGFRWALVGQPLR